MVVAVTAETARALRTHQKGGVAATAFYLGQVTVPVVGVVGGRVSFTGDGEVQGSGTVTVAGEGPSLVPRSKSDPLAVYGQELSLRRTVLVGDGVVEVPLGRFRITEVTDTVERRRGDVVTGWEATLKVQDRFEQIKADDFLSVDSPPANATTWSELRRLSPIPVQESLPGVTVPRSVVYDSRLGAVRELAGLMGGTPHLTREGALTVRPADAWATETVFRFDILGVISWSEGMTNDFFNQVQVKSSSDNDLVAYRQITDLADPLAVSRAGGRTYKYSSPVLTSQEAVEAAADTVLRRVSQKRSRPVSVVCGPEALLLELGDFGRISDPVSGRWATGEVFRIDVPLDPTEGVGVQLIVAEES